MNSSAELPLFTTLWTKVSEPMCNVKSSAHCLYQMQWFLSIFKWTELPHVSSKCHIYDSLLIKNHFYRNERCDSIGFINVIKEVAKKWEALNGGQMERGLIERRIWKPRNPGEERMEAKKSMC